MRDVTVRDQRTFAFLITNWLKVTMENIRLELPGFIHSGNQDGIHLQGPGRFLVLRNIQGRTGDDFIALNGDEETNGEQSWAHPCATVGPITDVLIDTVMVVSLLIASSASAPAGLLCVQYPNVPVMATSRCGVLPTPNE